MLPNKFRNICFLLFLVCFIFSSNTMSWAECSETGDYLICEDWDSGTPPDPWPTQDGGTWHDWTPADYGGGDDGDITEIRSYSGQRSLVQLKASGKKSTVDIEHVISDNPTVVYVRCYVYLLSGEIGNLGSYVHFIFLNGASSAECCLDFRGRSQEFCKPNCIGPNGLNGEDGSGYDWSGHVMLAPHTYNPEDWVVETEGVPFFWEEHTDEWVLVEWKVDFANDKTSLWINEILYTDNYNMDFGPSSATKIILSGYGQSTSGDVHYHIDDVVVSTSYIGPKDGGPPNTTPPNTSGHSPAKGSKGFYKDSNIIVHILDSDEGVDQSSIAMTVNGQTVSPDISGTSSDYTLTYDSPNPFEPGDVVVTLKAQDLANSPNVMLQETYKFTVSEFVVK
jgi:hypothetical protein